MPKCKTIAIVGASARAAAFSILRSGRQAVTADLFADVDLRRVCQAFRVDVYPNELLFWLRQIECDGWLYTGALENHPALVIEMAGVAPLLGSDPNVLQSVRSPIRLAEALSSADLLFPEMRTSVDTLPRDGTWLAKTGRGSSGNGVRLLDGESLSSEGIFYQRRVPGISCSAIFVALGKKSTMLGITRQLVGQQWTGAKPFQYCGSIFPLPLPPMAKTTIQQIGDTLAGAFDLQGLIGIDLVIDGEKVWVIEVNPRYTAAVEVIERASGVSAIDAHVAACCRDHLLPAGRAASPDHFHGKAILFAKTQVIVSERLSRWLLDFAGGTMNYQAADIPAVGTELAAGDPVATVFASGKDDEAVEKKLRQRITETQRLLYSER